MQTKRPLKTLENRSKAASKLNGSHIDGEGLL